MDIVYVLTQEDTGEVVMATKDDTEAWALYRDMLNKNMQIFLNKNKVASVESLNSLNKI